MTTQAVEEGTLEIITDSLARGYPQLAAGTLQEASEITNGRRLEPDPKKREDLRNGYFYTANLFLARKRGGKLEYGLSGREAFDGIAGQNIGEFSRQLINSGFYRLTPEQTRALPNFTGIEWVDPSKLNLQSVPGNTQWSFFEINTSDYFAEKLNSDQRRVAQKPYGAMGRKQEGGREYTDFGENMKMLKEAGKTTTGVYFPTPNYVEGSIKEGVVVARASRLLGFDVVSRFDAGDRFVDLHDGLRGVRNVVAEGDAPKVKVDPNPITQAYQTILGANPDQALRAMTPQIATGLAGLLQMYNTQKQ